MDIKLYCDTCGTLHNVGPITKSMIGEQCAVCGYVTLTETEYSIYSAAIKEVTRLPLKVRLLNALFFWKPRKEASRVTMIRGSYMDIETRR